MTMGYHITIGQSLSPLQVKKIEQVIDNTFQDIHRFCNPWNPESEISKLNRSEAGTFMLSPLLAKLLFWTEKCYQETGGLFDPTIGAVWNYWRQSLDQKQLPSQKDLENLREAQGWNQFELKDQKIIKKNSETQLDVCGVAKGFCVDLLVERLHSAGIKHALVEWGGEVYAFGNHPEKRAWCIAIKDQMPNGEILDLGTIKLCERAIASSGISQHFWTIESEESQKNYYHFIHPKTLQALSQESCPLLFCSVEAESCSLADAYSTTCMLLTSKEKIKNWFEEQTAISRLWALFRNGERLILKKLVGQTSRNFQNVGKLEP